MIASPAFYEEHQQVTKDQNIIKGRVGLLELRQAAWQRKSGMPECSAIRDNSTGSNEPYDKGGELALRHRRHMKPILTNRAAP